MSSIASGDMVQFVELPHELIRNVLKELNSIALQRFLVCKHTFTCAYHEKHTRARIEIQIGPQDFCPGHFDFGIYASRVEIADICCKSINELHNVTNQKLLRMASSIVFKATINETTACQTEEALLQLADILSVSRQKCLKLQFLICSPMYLQAVLTASKVISEIPSIQLTLKLELPQLALKLLCAQIGDLRINSLNLYIVTCQSTNSTEIFRLSLPDTIERLKIKSEHQLSQLDIWGPSLKWLEVDLPMDEHNQLFKHELKQFPSLVDLRLFQICSTLNLDFFVYLSYPKTLVNLYLYFDESISNSDATTIYHRNHQVKYFNLSDNRTSIAYRK